MSEALATGPLAGVRVLDFTERMQGPYGTQILADLGAEVIKVERRVSLTVDGRPDERYGPNGRYGLDPEDTTFYAAGFLANNRNKKSVPIDLKNEHGKELVKRLVAASDVVYENFRPGVMARLGFGYEDCVKLNPSVIYASASGFGPDGPYQRRPGQDVLTQAISGFGAMNVSADGRPTPVAMSITDLLGGMNGAIAVLAALHHRQRTGEGQLVEVNLLASGIAAQSEQAVHFLNSDVGEPSRRTVMHAHAYIPAPYGFYATKDGYLALSSGKQIPELCRILEIDDLSEDPRFSDPRSRDRHREEFEALLEAALQSRTTAEWLGLMIPEGLFAAQVNSFAEAFSDEQVEQQGMITTVDSPVGPLKLLAPPYSLSRTPATIRTAPPRHGEHTDEVLQAVGLTAEEISTLRAARAI
ncbi:CaiB/BaiF CoA transferase family protein [Mycolicibacterium tokaiense]|uniref:Recemase n=1 Tax=Mycolicibacterium tokaiense TaxID=39695 RepID=A0A378TEV8_9MYCO|nr:CaiB/BaiF CoA-transferase family protein [Mycolicibacterium tokaiense]BBY86332.1 CoA transferase [Mycolicibacterium tokaiense]STZ59160.1 recemase [Mycolicibacterium tokaiense]